MPAGRWATGPDFPRLPWAELGELPDGATLGLSHARYRDGMVLTLAMKAHGGADWRAVAAIRCPRVRMVPMVPMVAFAMGFLEVALIAGEWRAPGDARTRARAGGGDTGAGSSILLRLGGRESRNIQRTRGCRKTIFRDAARRRSKGSAQPPQGSHEDTKRGAVRHPPDCRALPLRLDAPAWTSHAPRSPCLSRRFRPLPG
jgi:hypothetical protein